VNLPGRIASGQGRTVQKKGKSRKIVKKIQAGGIKDINVITDILIRLYVRRCSGRLRRNDHLSKNSRKELHMATWRKTRKSRWNTIRRSNKNTRVWSPEEVAFLRKYYRNHQTTWVARQLGRTVYSVRYKASDLSIRKANPSMWKNPPKHQFVFGNKPFQMNRRPVRRTKRTTRWARTRRNNRRTRW
jgi:hypothetical protein